MDLNSCHQREVFTEAIVGGRETREERWEEEGAMGDGRCIQ